MSLKSLVATKKNLHSVFDQANDPVRLSDPVVIGGVGGSGTRVFANLLQSFDISIGDKLNPALDNLYFTLLLRREGEWANEFPSDDSINKAIEVFSKIQHRTQLSESDRNYLKRLLVSRRAYEPSSMRWDELVEAALAVRRTDESATSSDCWGWKEPNSHIFLKQLNCRFPKMKYIHVIRDGFDMAYSKNTRQLRAWGRHLGVELKTDVPTANELLDYWVAANYRTIEFGEAYMKDRFLAIHYESLCSSPSLYVNTVSEFLGMSLNASARSKFCSEITATSIGRYKQYNLDVFTKAQKADVAAINDYTSPPL